MINVTKSFLPPLEQYTEYLKVIWESGHLTNHGPLVTELEKRVKEYLGVKHFFFINNGTVALQIALKALDISGEVITTPFSYVATVSSISWENCTPVFADINSRDFTIDASKIEEVITPATTAILATHVYGIPCDVEAIDRIAKKHGLKVIYDAAHAFGVSFKGTSVLNYGDISTLSFHATKLFHTVEGGGIATNDDALAHRISYMRNFGHNGPEEFYGIGINGKSSEFHAAMGLCVLPSIDAIISQRKDLSLLYDKYLLDGNHAVQRPVVPEHVLYNYSYYPVVFDDQEELLRVRDQLNGAGIFPRRYFFPSLNKLPYVTNMGNVPVSEDIASRVLCLPLYYELSGAEVKDVCRLIIEAKNTIHADSRS